MRYVVLVLLMLMQSSLFAGIIKENKSRVEFIGFGKYTTHSNVKMTASKHLEESRNEFKGKGILGNIAAKLVLRPGHEAEIVDLDKKQIIKINHEKEEYQVIPLESYVEDYEPLEEEPYEAEEPQPSEQQEDVEAESDIRIIRQVFEVNETGNEKTINDFPSREFTIKWVTEWENIRTGERGTDSLFSTVWTTRESERIKEARAEEQAYSRKYMESIGLSMDEEYYQMLGLNWLTMFQQMNKEKQAEADVESEKMGREMQKIEGYPIVIDGSYFLIRPQVEKEQAKKQDSEKTDITDVGGMFGNIMKKAVKDKKKSEPKKEGATAAFSYYTELLDLKVTEVSESAFEAPAGYKQVNQ